MGATSAWDSMNRDCSIHSIFTQHMVCFYYSPTTTEHHASISLSVKHYRNPQRKDMLALVCFVYFSASFAVYYVAVSLHMSANIDVPFKKALSILTQLFL